MRKVTLVEGKRGCGYRRSGKDGVGVYLMGMGAFQMCERLPFPLGVCPVCGHGIKFSRGWTWVEPMKLFAPDAEPVCDPAMVGHDHDRCMMCSPPDGKHGLLWIGRKHYTPASFTAEAREMGISRRLASVPRDFEFGQTVYLAHVDAYIPNVAFGTEVEASPGIFTAFMPSHVDLVVDDLDEVPEKAMRIAKRIGDENCRVVKVVRDQIGLEEEE